MAANCIFLCLWNEIAYLEVLYCYDYLYLDFPDFDYSDVKWRAKVKPSEQCSINRIKSIFNIRQVFWEFIKTDNDRKKSISNTEAIVILDNFLSWLDFQIEDTFASISTLSKFRELTEKKTKNAISTGNTKIDAFFPHQ